MIRKRQAATVQNNAQLDVDAASRGMGSSTFLSDAKNRQYMAKSADIADINADDNAALVQTVQHQYNQYLQNKLNVDFTNRSNQIEVDECKASVKLALEELAYSRAPDAYERTGAAAASTGDGGAGSSRKKSGNSESPTGDGAANGGMT